MTMMLPDTKYTASDFKLSRIIVRLRGDESEHDIEEELFLEACPQGKRFYEELLLTPPHFTVRKPGVGARNLRAFADCIEQKTNSYISCDFTNSLNGEIPDHVNSYACELDLLMYKLAGRPLFPKLRDVTFKNFSIRYKQLVQSSISEITLCRIAERALLEQDAQPENRNCTSPVFKMMLHLLENNRQMLNSKPKLLKLLVHLIDERLVSAENCDKRADQGIGVQTLKKVEKTKHGVHPTKDVQASIWHLQGQGVGDIKAEIVVSDANREAKTTIMEQKVAMLQSQLEKLRAVHEKEVHTIKYVHQNAIKELEQQHRRSSGKYHSEVVEASQMQLRIRSLQSSLKESEAARVALKKEVVSLSDRSDDVPKDRVLQERYETAREEIRKLKDKRSRLAEVATAPVKEFRGLQLEFEQSQLQTKKLEELNPPNRVCEQSLKAKLEEAEKLMEQAVDQLQEKKKGEETLAKNHEKFRSELWSELDSAKQELHDEKYNNYHRRGYIEGQESRLDEVESRLRSYKKAQS